MPVCSADSCSALQSLRRTQINCERRVSGTKPPLKECLQCENSALLENLGVIRIPVVVALVGNKDVLTDP